MRLIDRGSGDLLNEYKGHKNSNYKLESCLTNDDAYVISGSEDGIIYIWDLVTTNIVAKLQGHSKTVCSIAFHPKDIGLLSTSTDETIRVWR